MPSPGPRLQLERNFQLVGLLWRRRTESDSSASLGVLSQSLRLSGSRRLGCVVRRNRGPEGGAGSRPGAAGRVLFPRARGARTVTATRARARPAAARPRDLRQPLRGARHLGRRRLGTQSVGDPSVPGPSPGAPGQFHPVGSRSRSLPTSVRARPATPLFRSQGRVLAAHAGRWRPAPPRRFPCQPDRHHGGPEACAAPPGGLTVPERRPRGARVPGLSPAPWPGPSLPA